MGSNAGRLVDSLIGGWSVQAIGQFQSGFPIDFEDRNVYFDGDPTTLKAKYSSNTDVPVFDISGFYFHDAAVQTNGVDDPVKQRADQRNRLGNNVRYFPSRLDGVRGPTLKTWDISLVKQVRLAGNVRAQFNIEFLNAFNQTYFNNANTDPTSVNFGKVTTPEQPAARHPARGEDRLLVRQAAQRKGRGQPASSLSFLSDPSTSSLSQLKIQAQTAV